MKFPKEEDPANAGLHFGNEILHDRDRETVTATGTDLLVASGQEQY